MNTVKPSDGNALQRRIHGEMVDSFDEELELEIDDERLTRLLDDISEHPEVSTIDRRVYFKELFRLQRELVKLQDWVVHQKLKVVVIFEGRDSAGKGGVIKRITQRLNPRVCRVAALPAPSERERTQWYFQRYVAHLPAAGEIVLFDRSWYNRAGVERVMGFCTDDEYEEFFHSVPEFERMLGRSGIVLIKYWFSITDDEQQFRFMMRIHDPLKQWKLSPMDLESRRRWERLHSRQGGNARAHQYSGSPLVGDRGRRQEESATELHASLVAAGPLRRGAPRGDLDACARAQTGLHPSSGAQGALRAGGVLAPSQIPLDERQSKPDVTELLGIAHHVDCGDTAIAMIERHSLDRSIGFAQHEAGEPVHKSGAQLNPR